MVLDDFSTSQKLPEEKSAIPVITIEKQPSLNKNSRVVLLIFALNVISALLFMRLVNRPVYDDPYNIIDVHAYATKGFSIATVLAQTNPPGPGSFVWMAEAVRLLKGEELLDGRIGALMSWVLLTAGILFLAGYSNFSEIWYGALLVVLVFPHTVEAGATILTEGPSLLFAALGALAWTEFASQPKVTPVTLILGIAGGLSMGVAVTCRQYNLALLPAATIFALYQFLRRGPAPAGRTIWLVSAIVSLVFAVAPVFLLVLVWKGLSSPGMATGTSYSNWQAGVGLNISRPMVVAFYIAVYLVPLTFPVMLVAKQAQRWGVILVALMGGAVAAYYSSGLLTPGPLHTVITTLARGPVMRSVVVGLVGVVTLYNTCALGQLLWEKRSMVLSSAPVGFALLTIVFFVGEQLGVGGNIPFYDRYVLSIAPFLGLIVFSVLPRLTYPRLLAFATMSLAGHIILWRYAFGG
jgi:hypothetical protein